MYFLLPTRHKLISLPHQLSVILEVNNQDKSTDDDEIKIRGLFHLNPQCYFLKTGFSLFCQFIGVNKARCDNRWCKQSDLEGAGGVSGALASLPYAGVPSRSSRAPNIL
jgi:hypothetical protein